MRSRLRQLKALSALERRAFAFTVAAIPLVQFALWSAGVARCERWFTSARAHGPRPDEGDVLAQLCRGARAASTRTWGGQNCLPRALALRWLLRRAGFPAELRIGADAANGTLAAHSWVEVDGLPLNEPEGVARRGVVFDMPAPRQRGDRAA